MLGLGLLERRGHCRALEAEALRERGGEGASVRRGPLRRPVVLEDLLHLLDVVDAEGVGERGGTRLAAVGRGGVRPRRGVNVGEGGLQPLGRDAELRGERLELGVLGPLGPGRCWVEVEDADSLVVDAAWATPNPAPAMSAVEETRAASLRMLRDVVVTSSGRSALATTIGD